MKTKTWLACGLFAAVAVMSFADSTESFEGIGLDKVRQFSEKPAYDRASVDLWVQDKLPYVDLLGAHMTDYAKYKIDVDDYLMQYYVGHYNPHGNFFHA